MSWLSSFITLRIYKVLKPPRITVFRYLCFITLRIYKVLKRTKRLKPLPSSFITLRIYKVLKLDRYKQGILQVLSH